MPRSGSLASRPSAGYLQRRAVGMYLAISTSAVLPSVGRKISTPNLPYAAQYLACALPVNASRLPSRTARASLGAGTVRYTFTVTDFHRLPFACLPRAPVHSIKSAVLTLCQPLPAPYERTSLDRPGVSQTCQHRK
jgi:hypothetical protein